MNKEILYEILNSKSEKYSAATIEGILNEELEKSPDEMDTDLVDLCLEALTTVDEGQLNRKKRRIKFTKVLTAAAIFVLVVGIGIPAFAKLFSVNVPEGVVSIYKNCFNIDISSNGNVDDIFKQLEQDGFENPYLPNIIFSAETEISDYNLQNDEYNSFITFNYSIDGIYGNVSINKYSEHCEIDFGKTIEGIDVEDADYFVKENVKGVISSNDEIIHLYYVESNFEYSILIRGNMKTASEIVNAFIK